MGETEGTAFVTYTMLDGVYRIEATEGATPENISQALDALATGTEDAGLNISPNSQWLILDTDRFDPECVGWPCLAIVSADLSQAEAIRAGGELVHPEDFSAVSSDGDFVVFPGSGGPHDLDLWAVRRSGDEWDAPELLTGSSSFAFNSFPAISDDGDTVLFNCGPQSYGQTRICEVGADGAGFREAVGLDDGPAGLPTAEGLHHADYAPDNAIVFEGDWDGEEIWRLEAGASAPTRMITAYSNDNSPCVLPDGRIASLWLGRPEGQGIHELKVMNADGSSHVVLLADIDVLDIGLGCGGSATPPADDDGTPDEPAATLFPAESIWYEDISSAPLDAESDEVIAWLEDAGGWGADDTMRIDFSIEVLQADADTPFLTFIPTEDFYTPDCDAADVPVPDGGALDGEVGYECESDGDCHLIVVHEETNQLFEMWRANIVDGEFFGGCLVVWDMTRVYGDSGRGENCTSADAAGYPVAPLLFNADEVAAGSIDHAIRFILPNERIRHRVYVHPATHSTGATSGPDSAPPYGARFRLRADFPLDSLPNEGARVVARALQHYGMFLADAGQIALTAQSDRFTTAKWTGLLDTRDLEIIRVGDFEMVEAGERFEFSGDCVREPVE